MPLKKRNPSGPFAICWLAFALAANVAAAQTNFEKTPDGILIHFGRAQIELAAANADTLRLSVALDGAPQFSPSTFLADTNAGNSISWKMVRRGKMVGVETKAGELLMNPKNGDWLLKNSDGKILIPQYKIGDFKNETAPENSSVVVVLGWKKNKPIYVYGCGNGTNSLEQSGGAVPEVANRRTVIPYFWSDAGYAVLAVTADDNRPAFWCAATNENFLKWIFPGKIADLYFMPSATLKDAAKNYAGLTGHAPVPPRWTFGYLQSRWGWKNQAYIEDTLKKFHELKIPVDAFIFDFEWYTKKPDYKLAPGGTTNYDDFGWNTNLFPNPAGQIKNFHKQGLHAVFIRKPRMGNTATLTMIREKHWSLVVPPGQEKFHARDVDFANPDFREWYVAQSKSLLADGIDGWWNDEGEGAFTEFFYWNVAESDAFARYKIGERFWSINRAFSPGMQRLGAAAWTGDIQSSWKILAETPTSLLNWTLAGMPYVTCDIGGYSETPSPELLTRWMEAGVFFPILRTHSELTQTPHFPWLYGAEAVRDIRKAIDLRYRLIPFYYSLAHETFETGVPLMRPLEMEFPNDPNVANLSDEWLMGSSLLAAPILQPDNRRSIYLPAGNWFAFGTNLLVAGNRKIEVAAGLDEIPIYIRAGTILSLGPIIQYTGQLPGGPLELQIYPGKDATFTLFEDDGETTNYLGGQIRRTIFKWRNATGQLSWTREGNYSGKDVFKNLRVVVFDPRGKLEAESPLNSRGSLTFSR